MISIVRPLFAKLSAETARTYGLVLSAAGINHTVVRQGPMWMVAVLSSKRAAAIEAVSLYLKENPPRSSLHPTIYSAGPRTYSAWYIASILVLVHLLVIQGHAQDLFAAGFGADASRILAGEFYRCVTALLLHADVQHLLGNVAGLILFGTATASLCGWGLGWALILSSGAVGNLMTAFWYQNNHMAIGASTAVFGAVGLCAVLNLRIRTRENMPSAQRAWRRWMPLAGGLALLGFLGTSPHADLMAHLCGFLAGVLLGAVAGLWKGRPLCQAPGWVQWAGALAAFGTVAACWVRGFSYSG